MRVPRWAPPHAAAIGYGGSLVGFDTLTGTVRRAAGETVGAYAVDASGLANPNYLVTVVGGKLKSVNERKARKLPDPAAAHSMREKTAAEYEAFFDAMRRAFDNSGLVPPAVRLRRPISVRTTGKTPAATPTSTAHNHAPSRGNSSSPVGRRSRPRLRRDIPGYGPC